MKESLTSTPACATTFAKSSAGGWWYNIDREWLLRPKVIYSAYSSLNYAFYVYRETFYSKYLGLNRLQYGTVQAIFNVASLVGVLIWGRVGDWWRIHRTLVLALTVGMTLSFLIFTLKGILPSSLHWSCAMVGAFFYGLFHGGLGPLMDHQILNLLLHYYNYPHPQHLAHFGKQLVAGSAVYGLITYAITFPLRTYGVKILFIVVPLTALFTFLTIYLLGSNNEDESDVKAVDRSNNVKSTRIISMRYVRLLGIIFASGVGRQTLVTFLPSILLTLHSLNLSQMALAYLIPSLLSPAFYHYLSPSLVHLLRQHDTTLGNHMTNDILILLGQAALVLRISLYAYTRPTPTTIIFIEILNSLSYSLTHVAAVNEAAQCAPPGWEATFQSIYGCAHVQVPAILCSLVGGMIYQWNGGLFLLKIVSILPTISILYLIVSITLQVCR